MSEESERGEVLRSNTPSFCVSCYYCTVRYPQEIPTTELMCTLKRISMKTKLYDDSAAPDFPETLVDCLERYEDRPGHPGLVQNAGEDLT